MSVYGNYHAKNLMMEDDFNQYFKAEHMKLENANAILKKPKENDKVYQDLLKKEAEILWQLSEYHSIPHVKDFIELGRGINILVMNHFQGKTLDDFLLPLDNSKRQEEVAWVSERLLGALYYCHYNGVVHGDIKPSNVFIEEDKHDIKLVNFSLSLYKPDMNSRPIGYDPTYAAPEIRNEKTPLPESDIYGAGMFMVYALGGNPKLKTLPDYVSDELKEFCFDLVKENPLERPSWEKTNLVQDLSDIRKKVFGSRRTKNYSKTKV